MIYDFLKIRTFKRRKYFITNIDKSSKILFSSFQIFPYSISMEGFLCSGVHRIENIYINTSHMIRLNPGPPQDCNYVNLPSIITNCIVYFFFSLLNVLDNLSRNSILQSFVYQKLLVTKQLCADQGLQWTENCFLAVSIFTKFKSKRYFQD